MHPSLFSLFGYPVGAYGFFMAAAQLIGALAALTLARSDRRPIGPFLDMLFAVLFFGLLGARLGYAFNRWEEFQSKPWELFSIEKDGLSFFGGFAPGFFAFVGVARWRKIPVLAAGDLLCPVLPLSLAIMRVGCFLAGCCYGAPTNVPWAITFFRLDSKVPLPLIGLSLHPSQLYEVMFLLILAATLALLHRRKLFPAGILATFSIFSYSLFRLAADFFRGDLDRGFWGQTWMAPTQAAAILGVLATPIVLGICLRVSRKR